MLIKKFITIAGFVLAIMSIVYQDIKQPYILFGLFVGLYLLIWMLMYVEKKIRDSQGEFINKCFYYLGKTEEPYIIEYVESCYEYIDRKEMAYTKKLELKSRVNNLHKYEDKFCWSSYSSSITINPLYPGQQINKLASKNLWSVLEIGFGERCKKGKSITTGMKIVGLKDEMGIAKPFLSHRSDKKIKERVMTVKIPKELIPINAKYEIYKTSATGKVIKSEPLEYDNSISGYSKRITFPRKGWTYAIVWEWGE